MVVYIKLRHYYFSMRLKFMLAKILSGNKVIYKQKLKYSLAARSMATK
jgi:hypothetical protein